MLLIQGSSPAGRSKASQARFFSANSYHRIFENASQELNIATYFKVIQLQGCADAVRGTFPSSKTSPTLPGELVTHQQHMFGNFIWFDAAMVTDGYLLALTRGAVPSWRSAEWEVIPSAVPAWPVADASLASVTACAGTQPNRKFQNVKRILFKLSGFLLVMYGPMLWCRQEWFTTEMMCQVACTYLSFSLSLYDLFQDKIDFTVCFFPDTQTVVMLPCLPFVHGNQWDRRGWIRGFCAAELAV